MPNCPSCGDRLSGIGPLVRSLECPSCAHWVFASEAGWSDGGRFAHQLEAPPLLGIGRAGRIGERVFTVAGRVRLGSEDGHWDEWWLESDGGTGFWLEEDDGRYALHESVALEVGAPVLAALGVGGTFTAGGSSWFVTEAFDATPLGAQGQLPFAFDGGTRLRCLDAVAAARELSVELWPDGASASIAAPLPAARIALA